MATVSWKKLFRNHFYYSTDLQIVKENHTGNKWFLLSTKGSHLQTESESSLMIKTFLLLFILRKEYSLWCTFMVLYIHTYNTRSRPYIGKLAKPGCMWMGLFGALIQICRLSYYLNLSGQKLNMQTSLSQQKLGMQTISNSKTLWSIFIVGYAAVEMVIFVFGRHVQLEILFKFLNSCQLS